MPLITFIVFSSFVVYVDLGRCSRATTTTTATTCRRSTRRSCSATRRTPASGRGTGLVAAVRPVLAGAADPGLPAGVPDHLLLLPRRLLQGVLGRPARLRRRRAAQRVPRRAQVAAASSRTCTATRSTSRWSSSCCSPTTSCKAFWFTTGHGHATFGIGVGTLRAAHQRRPDRRLHVRLPLVAPPGRRRARRAVEGRPRARRRYDCVELPQPPAHDVGVVQPVLGRRSPTSTSASARWASSHDWRIF